MKAYNTGDEFVVDKDLAGENERFEYKFVKLPVALVSMFSSTRQPLEDYKKIIRDHAKLGWRLVQIFAPGLEGNGKPGSYEIIFERRRS